MWFWGFGGGSKSRFGVSKLGFWGQNLGLGFRIWDFGGQNLGLGFRILVWGFEFGILGSKYGFGVSYLAFWFEILDFWSNRENAVVGGG